MVAGNISLYFASHSTNLGNRKGKSRSLNKESLVLFSAVGQNHSYTIQLKRGLRKRLTKIETNNSPVNSHNNTQPNNLSESP